MDIVDRLTEQREKLIQAIMELTDEECLMLLEEKENENTDRAS